MKIYKRTNNHLFCGHWNCSPLEIGMTERLMGVPEGEANHYHEFHEFYLVLDGRGQMEVQGEVFLIEKGSLLMIEPGEVHRISGVDPEAGFQWVIIKEQSAPDGKRFATHEHTGQQLAGADPASASGECGS